MIHFTNPNDRDSGGYRYLLYLNGQKLKENGGLLPAKRWGGQIIHLTIPIFPEDENDMGAINNYVKPGDEIMVEMQCVDDEYYEFLRTWSEVRNGDSTANPINNIKGGALGYFGAYSWGRKTVVVTAE
jgi:hypothetical protein